LPASIAWAVTFGAVIIGWVFFRAPSLQRARVILGGMAGLNGFDWPRLPYSIGGNRFRLLLPALAVVLWCPNRQAIMKWRWKSDYVYAAAFAILAGVTSLHGVLLVHSRDVYALARDRVLPALFAWVHPMTGTPAAGVVTLTVLGLLGVLAGAALFDYALLAVLGVLFLQVCAGLALLRMPSYSTPGRFALPAGWRRIVGLGLIITSGAFALFGALERPVVALVFGLVMLAGILYYSARRQLLLARGQQLDELFAHSLDQ
jgi:amino acid transporter